MKATTRHILTRGIHRFVKRNEIHLGVSLAVLFLLHGFAHAHCDTMDGPVVKDAQAALEKRDVTPALKWVRGDQEAEIRKLFGKTLVARTQGSEAKELAEAYFFETLVRLHREGEGAGFTGLKPPGTPLEPGVAQTDQALASGTADHLVESATEAVAAGIKKRFETATQARQHADESVEAGRAFARAYVELVHYVEGILARANGETHAHDTQSIGANRPAPDHEKPTASSDSEHRH